jgi:nucleoside-diphosphate-sugar epimerase
VARTLVVGGTGPTGPHIVAGLEARGHDVTVCHTGAHELPEVAHLPHLHGDVRDPAALHEMLGATEWDVAVVTYGRLRAIAEVLAGRVGHLVSVGGAPAYRGYFDPGRWNPPGMPVPTREDAPTSTSDDDGKSYRIVATEEAVFAHHPTATHFRYPFVYGPRQLVPREWCIVRRILDGRPHIVVPDGGAIAHTFGFTENLAHAVLLAVDRPGDAAGRIFNCGDDEVLTLRQVIDICATELDHEWELISMPAELAVPARPLLMQPTSDHRVLDTAAVREVLGYRDLVPARTAVARTARWLADHPADSATEAILEDPFDYANEDRLIAAWTNAIGGLPELDWPVPPGYGLAYAGPGATRARRPGL